MKARKLRLSFANGYTSSGKEAYKQRTVARVNPNLDDGKCKEFAMAINALYAEELKKAVRIDETDIAL